MIEVLRMDVLSVIAVGAAALVRLEERGLVDSVAVDNSEEIAVADFPDLPIAENGYGSSEVVKLVAQQFPCNELPQHQLLPLGSQRVTSLD